MYDEEKWAKADADLQRAFVGVAGLVEGMLEDSDHYFLKSNERKALIRHRDRIDEAINGLEAMRVRVERRARLGSNW